jgi:hypothetical protein
MTHRTVESDRPHQATGNIHNWRGHFRSQVLWPDEIEIVCGGMILGNCPEFASLE